MVFLVFEGLDGSGKTSLIKQISEFLTRGGKQSIVTREPGGTPLGEDLRKLLLKTDGEAPTPRCELLLYEAIRAQHVDKVIQPALQHGKWVICDRFTASSLAFQKSGRGLKTTEVEWLNSFATQGLAPHLNILLDLSVEQSRQRQEKRFSSKGEKADRFEMEQEEFHERVRQNYLEQARAHPRQWLVLDASQTTENMFKQVVQTLKEKKWLDS